MTGRVMLLRRDIGVVLALLGLSLAPSAARAQIAARRTAPPDAIFTGRFITLDSLRPRAEAIAVRGGVIVAIGSRAHVDSTAGPSTRRVHIPGTLLPGFADAHVHALYLGALLGRADLHGISKAETLQRMRAVARATPAGQWINGDRWEESYWRPAAFPTAAELDSVTGDHPAVLSRIDGHALWINSRAMRLAGITRATRDPSGGRIVHDASGEPTGVLVDEAMELVTRVIPAPTAAEIERQLRAAFAQYLAWGLTSIHDAGQPASVIAVYRSLAARGAIPLRVYLMVAAPGAAFDEALQRGPEVATGAGMLTIRSAKVVLDGALGSRGAELTAPYSDAPEHRGLAIVSDSVLDSIIARAAARGFQVNVHAIGDGATHRLLDAIERAGPAVRALRFRDEHSSMITDADLPRFRQLGVIASMQPTFVGEYSRFAEDRVGPDRIRWVYRTRDVLESGAVVASGTDYPAADAGDPVSTLFSMVTRRGADGTPTAGWIPAQGVGIDAALRSMTSGAAYASFDEGRRGALTVGRVADFTALSADPYLVAPDSLRSLRVLTTVVNGQIRYRAPAP